MKTPRGHIQVVQDGNDEVNARDNIFQLDELVNPYWVTSSTYFKENSNFLIAENTFIDVDAEELNDILAISEFTKLMNMMISTSNNSM